MTWYFIKRRDSFRVMTAPVFFSLCVRNDTYSDLMELRGITFYEGTQIQDQLHDKMLFHSAMKTYWGVEV
jgi:hypothetical protein